MNITKTHSLVAKRVGSVKQGCDYCVNGHLLVCSGIIKRIYKQLPSAIKITASTASFKGAKRIFIHPGHKNWGWNSKHTSEARHRGMYSYMAVLLYIKLNVNALGDQHPWFGYTEYLPPLSEPVAIYVKITKV